MMYELLYIIPATIADDELSSAEGAVAAILEKHGARVAESVRLGKLRFAYPIKKTRYGHYTLVHFNAEGGALAKIEADLRILNTVLRYLILKQEGETKTPFTLIQYSEVNVETKDGGRRRKKSGVEKKDTASREEITSGVKAIETAEDAETPNVSVEDDASAAPLSDQELDKKLSDVLKKDEAEA